MLHRMNGRDGTRPMSSSYSYHVTDVFTDRAFGGNPLAIFPDAQGLTDGQMQAIAKELNLSETTFVTPAAPGHFAVRIFTPGAELPFAGHPIIGTAIVLASLGRTQGAAEIFLDLKVGPVRVVLNGPNAVFFRDGPPEFRPLSVSDADIAAIIGADALAEPAFQCGYGSAFIFAPLPSRAAVARAQLRLDLWRTIEDEVWGHGIYLYARTAPDAVHARLFAPALGVGEDPATGSAAAGLIGALPGAADATQHITITQGVEMGRPSSILATATRAAGLVQQISIGGSAVLVAEGRFTRLPPT